MSDLDPELRQLLAPIREAKGDRASEPGSHPGPRSVAPRAHDPRSAGASELSAAARERILGTLRQQVRGVPRARRRARIVRRVRLGALFSAGLLACGAFFWPQLTPGAESLLAQGSLLFGGTLASRDSGALHIAATGVSPLSWTGSQGETQELRGELDLPGDGELHVPVLASALLTTAGGVRIDAAERTRVRLRGAAGAHAEGLALERGTVRCRVPPLGKGRSFVVSTATTRVVVHGTDFSVELAGEAGADAPPSAHKTQRAAATSPCVRVREGLVEVQHGSAPSAWLGPGSEWGCEGPAVSERPALVVPSVVVAARVDPVAAPEQVSKLHHHHGRGRALAKAHRVDRSLRVEASDEVAEGDGSVPVASTLERENQLLAEGLRAEQSGDKGRARRLFAALLAHYPSSPLAPEARAGLTRTRAPKSTD
jgi:hypothetical protein